MGVLSKIPGIHFCVIIKGFGHAVALNKDGTRLIVGAPRTDRGTTDTGSCYVYDRGKAASMTGPEDYSTTTKVVTSLSLVDVFEVNDISGIDNDSSSYMGVTLLPMTRHVCWYSKKR